ncbi:MAG: isoprenylcysteine carboxylmethyltransferase family protein [Chloroflexi bacterium]|nr:MAG: isoprenylcysteine carboxylmethyltransferase family protein [Chloroflexota bacterium]MBL1194496.1 isoprenylcysteine carboxylmethyltransferase family protein [Chloroflexota bacterium]NOH11784.1 isoprenylcysteine carboxylmethyltransferase family protein [Chloroflexota bacterium]
MTTQTNIPAQTQKATLNKDGVKRIITVFAVIFLYGVLLFASAGRLTWIWAWVYLGIYTAVLVVNAVVILRTNPEVVNERGRTPEDQKGWDKIIVRIFTSLTLASMILAGLDAGRFGWSSMPLWLHLAAIPVAVFAYIIIIWTMMHNDFLSQKVAVQTERGHTVASTGPYRYVRHPMYTSMMLGSMATPLILGSWWMYIPVVLSILVFIIRTALEDRTLQEELDGYQAYAQTVRYRLIPGVW